MFLTFATILSFHHQQLSSSSPFPRSRLTSTRKQRSSMTTAKFILPVPGLLCNVQFIYTFLFFSICHRSRFRSSFLIQGLVIQAHLCLSPMVPICGTLWHCRQSLIRICRDRKYLHDMFQHFPRKGRVGLWSYWPWSFTNTSAFFEADPWFLFQALNWKRGQTQIYVQ